MDARVLGDSDVGRVRELLASDPVRNVFVASRVDAGLLSDIAGGELWGYPGHDVRALLHVGANLVPVRTDDEARAAFVRSMGAHRSFSAIVGRSDEVTPLWKALCLRWGPAYARARVVRQRQPVMATERRAPVDADPRVRRIGLADFDGYFAAAVHMYTDELQEDPLVTNPVGYRRYVQRLIADGRAFGIVENGRVLFKADLGAVGGGVAQVQGVWVNPENRGQGLAVPAMASVTNAIVDAGRTASLYVNDFNAPAIATYRRCGYTERGTFTTILY